MGAFIARQPNGRLCRFSSIVDTVTHYNMTDEEYIELCAERAREEARDVIEHHLKPFDWVEKYYNPRSGNMSKKEFRKIMKEMQEPVE